MTLFPPSTHTPHQSSSLVNYTFNLSLTHPFVATPDMEALVRCLFSLELEPGQQTLYGLIPSSSHPPTISILSNSTRWPFENAAWLISLSYLKSITFCCQKFEILPCFPSHGSSLMSASPATTSKVCLKLCSNFNFDYFFSSESLHT